MTTAATAPKLLCLHMIVKNESPIIERLLQSVAHCIDEYCICDTGSTDDTVERIRAFFRAPARAHIAGRVETSIPFTDFAETRNRALDTALCYAESAYLLLLDADMVFVPAPGFDLRACLLSRPDRNCCVYMCQGSQSFSYQNVRIVRNDGACRYAGVTHECMTWSTAEPGQNALVLLKHQCFLLDFADGGCRADKFARDERLLLAAIATDPTNARNHFYLANTYFDVGQWEAAAAVYSRRMALGGWAEEVAYSAYRRGRALKALGRSAAAVESWLQGFEAQPLRAECIYEIASLYRDLGQHRTGMHFCRWALELVRGFAALDDAVRETGLFVHTDVYTYKVLFEYTVLAAHTGIRAPLSREFVTIFNCCDDPATLYATLFNLKFYPNVLRADRTVCLDNGTVVDPTAPDMPPLVSSSLSLCAMAPSHTGGAEATLGQQGTRRLAANVRHVNYRIDPDTGEYLRPAGAPRFVSANRYVELDADTLQVIETAERVWHAPDKCTPHQLHRGIEDLKLFVEPATSALLFLGTGFRADGVPCVVVGAYPDGQDTAAGLEGTAVRPSFLDRQVCEKNWVFAMYRGLPHIVYQWYPLFVCTLARRATDTGSENGDGELLLDLVAQKPMPRIFAHARGSSCGCVYTPCCNKDAAATESEIWFVVHLVSQEPKRHYYHMLAVFDADMNLLRYSAPFTFAGERIEFCLSITVEDSRVLLAYSTHDSTSRIAVCAKDTLDAMLVFRPDAAEYVL